MPPRREAAPAVTPAHAPALTLGTDAPESSPAGVGEVDRIAQLFEQLGGAEGYTVRLQREQTPGMLSKFAGHLGTVPFSLDLLDEVSASWGGGRYRGRVYSGNDYKGSVSFQIAGPPRMRDDNGDEPQRAPAPRDAFADALARLADTQTAILEELRSSRNNNGGIAQFAEVARIVRDLQPAPAPAASGGIAEAVTALTGLLDLRRQIVEDSEPPAPRSELAQVVERGVTPLVELAGRALSVREKELALRPTANGAPRPNAPVATVAAPAALPADPLAALVSRVPGIARSFLASKASAGKDPALYADVVLDVLDDAQRDELRAVLARDDFGPAIVALVPQWSPYPGWFSQLGDELRAALDESEEADETEEGVEVPPAVES